MVWQDITLKDYLKVLTGIVLISVSSLLIWTDNVFWNIPLLIGTILLCEHIYTWEEFSVRDILGHEWAGLTLILIVMFSNLNWRVLVAMFSNFDWRNLNLLFPNLHWIALVLLLIGVSINLNFTTPFKNEFKRLKDGR